MIYTVTVNPSIDYVVESGNFKLNEINIYDNPVYSPGGKGINVSLILKELGANSTALGFAAGFTGTEILRFLENKGIERDFLFLKDGINRINIKVRSREETEINGAGPHITEDEATAFLQKFRKIKDGDTLVIAGSLSKALPADYYSKILEITKDKNIMVIVDAVKDTLLETLKYSPFLIKPNHLELGDIFGTEIKTPQDAEIYGRKLCDMGAQNTVVSMGAMGALLIPQGEKSVFVPAVKGKVISPCCSGDSMVAGFIYGYSLNGSPYEAIKWGTAAGSATAFSQGLATEGMIKEIFNTQL